LQVAASDELLSGGHRSERRRDVDAPVVRRVRAEPARCLLELSLAAGTPTAAGLVPGDGDVDEPLQKVSLRRWRLAPLVLELLVRGEELPGGDQLQTSVESHGVRGRRS
jgi:hypothetical protein